MIKQPLKYQQYQIESEQFDHLAPVHHIILDFLSELAPIKYLLLSHKHYKKLIPRLYRSVTFSDSFFAAFDHPASYTRMIHVVSHTKSITIAKEFDGSCLIRNDHTNGVSTCARIPLPSGLFSGARMIEISCASVEQSNLFNLDKYFGDDQSIRFQFLELLGLGFTMNGLDRLVLYASARSGTHSAYRLDQLAAHLVYDWKPKIVTIFYKCRMDCLPVDFLVRTHVPLIQYVQRPILLSQDDLRCYPLSLRSALINWRFCTERLRRLAGPEKETIEFQIYSHENPTALIRKLQGLEDRQPMNNKRYQIRNIIGNRLTLHHIDNLDLDWSLLNHWKKMEI